MRGAKLKLKKKERKKKKKGAFVTFVNGAERIGRAVMREMDAAHPGLLNFSNGERETSHFSLNPKYRTDDKRKETVPSALTFRDGDEDDD